MQQSQLQSPLRVQPPPTITFAAPGCVIGHWKSLSIAVWATEATLPLVQELVKMSELMHRTYPKVSAAHIVTSEVRPPSPEVRAALDELTVRFASGIACTGLIIEGTGFWASAIRGVLTGLRAIRPWSFKFRTFAAPRDLSKWLAATHSAESGDTIDAAELEQVLLWMRDQPTVR